MDTGLSLKVDLTPSVRLTVAALSLMASYMLWTSY